MTPVETLLSRLKKVRKTPSGWTASCPAHDDQTPSLSVTEGEGGKALVHCHAGCELSAIAEAVEMKVHEFFPVATNATARRGRDEPESKSGGNTYASMGAAIESCRRGNPTEIWHYHDAAGGVVGAVVRWDDPKKRYLPLALQDGRWRIGAMLEPRPLYGLPELASADLVIVCEGEKAADAARALGFVATTSAGGSSAAAKTDWTPIAGKDVYFFPDNDESGAKYADDVAAILTALEPPAEVRIVELPNLPPKGDIVEWTDAHGEAAEPESMKAEIEVLARACEPWHPSRRKWPEMIHFNERELPQFPTHALPKVLRNWVEAESHATQTPADLAGLLALAACSACIARRVVVRPRNGWREPVNVYVAVLLEPGNRKSAVFADALHPLRELEAELIEAAEPEVARARSRRRIREREVKKLEEKAATKGDSEARRQAEEIAAELAKEPEPVLPRLIVDDATAEKLGMMLADQGGRIASMSPEGGVFDLMAGLYSKNGVPQFNVYLMGHSGDDLTTDRVSRKTVRVTRPAITCAYAMQPAVIKGLAREPAFRGRGLLARFLYAAPRSWIGSREVAPTPVPVAAQEAYYQAVRKLAEVEGDVVLDLTADAAVLLAEWEAKIEVFLDDGERMEAMRDWGAKLAGATLRLAAVLHCVEQGTAGCIARPTIAAAAEIARYLVPHAEAVLMMMSASEKTASDDAQYLMRWIERRRRCEFTKTEAQHHGKRRFPKADSIDPALAELARRGFIRLIPATAAGPGRPPSPTYEVNPAAFAKGTPERRSQYSHNAAQQTEGDSCGNTGNANQQFGDSHSGRGDESGVGVEGVEPKPALDGLKDTTLERGKPEPPASKAAERLFGDDDELPSAYRHGV